MIATLDYALRMSILSENIAALLERDARQDAMAKAVDVQQSTISRWATGSEPKPDKLIAVARYAGVSVETLAEVPIAKWAAAGRGVAPAADDRAGEQVEIQHIDLAFGLGATFTDSPLDVDLLRFPRAWIETITISPAALLTWTRGRGDSMMGTIDDGDLVLLDRSQTRVTEQDAMWAFTVGDTASIKRLRVKGDRFQILSDNPSVPMDEEPIDFVNIVARVVFVGKRK